MNGEQFDTFWKENEQHLVKLIGLLIPDIGDEYRASDDPEDDTPAMQITISCNDANDLDSMTWSYQTGDNSYTGSCYGDPYWGVGAIYRDSDPAKVAKELIEDLANQIYWSDWNE